MRIETITVRQWLAIALGVFITLCFAIGFYHNVLAPPPDNKPVVVIKQLDQKLVQAVFNEDLTNAELIDALYKSYPTLKPALDTYKDNTVTNRLKIAEVVGVSQPQK